MLPLCFPTRSQARIAQTNQMDIAPVPLCVPQLSGGGGGAASGPRRCRAPPPPRLRNQISGNPGGSSRARRDLNADTIREMHRAFREGGRAAINKVMETQPAAFLKLLVLLVPREMKVEYFRRRQGHDG